ncbi:T9SS type B sorting domain-containing protein [Ulvibacterium sp.]|uniref:T9SS type B sorting domain-containing protein n=1 Tax=Ulvibacterium sp. TaxID=2665914 RepID=UPI002610F314|nr:T9SS type B sorting domain-containing protein [Ulvibacterium sp.]
MNKTIALLLWLGITFPVFIFGQGETSTWYFGNGAGILFNDDGSVSPLTNGMLETFEGCATISDSFGNLLFYTDGITVYDRTHSIMENGRGLYGDPSSTQSALIVPAPSSPEIFYIFTVDTSTFENDPDRGLNYSVVDISQNSGNGAVTEKNISLLKDCSEKITAVVKDCSDQSIWVMTLASETGSRGFLNTYHAFEVNANGVVEDAIRTTFGDLKTEDPRGYLKFSSDGTKMASANMRFGLYVYDFDAETGKLSNQNGVTLPVGSKNPYGIEFSPNGRYLYVHASNDLQADVGHSSSLFQLDMEAEDLSSSSVVLDKRAIYRGALQLGSNGKIYRTLSENYFTGSSFLGVINKPNERGMDSEYIHNAISLDGKSATQGLPPFIQSFFNKIELIQNEDGTTSSSLDLCEGQPFLLETESIAGAVYIWKKDGVVFQNPSTNSFQINAADETHSGKYSLEILLPDPKACPILGESLINVHPLPPNGQLTLVQCEVDMDKPTDGITSVNLNQIVPGPEYTYSFFETVQDRNLDIPILNPERFVNTQAFDQIIHYRVTNSLGCENFGEIQVEIKSVDLEETAPMAYYTCDDNPVDEILVGTFDLENFGNRNYPQGEVVFYQNLEDVALEQNPLPSLYSTEPKMIFARLENLNQCEDIVEIDLRVNASPYFTIQPVHRLCTDNPNLRITGPYGFDTYTWFKEDGNSRSVISNDQQTDIHEVGNYTLEVAYVYDVNRENLICARQKDFTVLPSNKALLEDILIEDISENNTVQVVVSGDGDYEFSLDESPYQDEAFFDDVTPGFRTISVRDKNGCGSIEKPISVIGYPKFFTPNGDGVNDFWQIIGVDQRFQANTSVTIFNRYGKQVAQIGPGDIGWNGTYNAKVLPASDYWFSAILEDGREFKGHFALKR